MSKEENIVEMLKQKPTEVVYGKVIEVNSEDIIKRVRKICGECIEYAENNKEEHLEISQKIKQEVLNE